MTDRSDEAALERVVLFYNVFMETCNHTSVGMLVWRDKALLLIERRKPPYGFAPPAGHVDEGESYETAAKRELQEEVGLETQDMRLLVEGRKENACRRPDGSWHHWKIYEAITSGEVQHSLSETKQAAFVSSDDLALLANRTKRYLLQEIEEEEWQASPGLEPVWYEWLQEIGVLK